MPRRRTRAHDPRPKKAPVFPVHVRVVLTPTNIKDIAPAIRPTVLELAKGEFRRVSVISPTCVIVRNHPR